MTMENVAPGFRGHHSFIATALFQMIKRRPVHSSLILQWSGLCITIDLTWLALSEDEYNVLGLGLGVIVTYWGARNGAVSESTRLPPMWPRFKSWHRSHVWVGFVVGSLPMLREVFLQVLRFSPLLKNQHFQIPIRPGIRQTKNHYVDVLPQNRFFIICLFVYLLLFLGDLHTIFASCKS